MVKLSNDFGELVAGIRAEHTNNIYTMLQKFEELRLYRRTKLLGLFAFRGIEIHSAEGHQHPSVVL